MKSVCIRVEDDLHRRLKLVTLYTNKSVQDFVLTLLEKGIAEAEMSGQKDGKRAWPPAEMEEAHGQDHP